jgi:hypothetical protein
MTIGLGTNGLVHITLAVAIMSFAGLIGSHPDEVAAAFGHDEAAKPRVISTVGNDIDRCRSRSVDTIAGVLGCEGARRDGHLERITLRKD